MAPLIIIIDDDQDNLHLIEAILKHSGYETLGITSADAALEILGRITPSIVILNLLMAPMNGFDLTWRIRMMRHLSEVPVVMVSAQAELLVLNTPPVHQVDAFLSKPVKRRDVLSLVDGLLETAVQMLETGSEYAVPE